MKKNIAIMLLILSLFAIISCGGDNTDSPESGLPGQSPPARTPDSPQSGAVAPDSDSDPEPGHEPDPDPAPEIPINTPPPAPVDHTGGLERGADGILIGSAVFDGPKKLMGMGKDQVVIINVREGPDINAPRITDDEGDVITITKGQMVEAYSIENGWYRVTVYPGEHEGYIRSDLLVPYDDDDNT